MESKEHVRAWRRAADGDLAEGADHMQVMRPLRAGVVRVPRTPPDQAV